MNKNASLSPSDPAFVDPLHQDVDSTDWKEPRGDGEEPPHTSDSSKTGGYPVLSKDPRGDGEEPPHNCDSSKTGGYPILSEEIGDSQQSNE